MDIVDDRVARAMWVEYFYGNTREGELTREEVTKIALRQFDHPLMGWRADHWRLLARIARETLAIEAFMQAVNHARADGIVLNSAEHPVGEPVADDADINEDALEDVEVRVFDWAAEEERHTRAIGDLYMGLCAEVTRYWEAWRTASPETQRLHDLAFKLYVGNDGDPGPGRDMPVMKNLYCGPKKTVAFRGPVIPAWAVYIAEAQAAIDLVEGKSQ